MNLIGPQSLVTLNFRFTLTDGTVVLSTFESTPATLQIGKGELGTRIEECLIGLAVGTQRSFDLAEGEAFGQFHEALVEWIPRHELPADVEVEPRAVLTFTAPDGNAFSGQILDVSDDAVQIDFNHPLAGRAVRFDVEIVGVN
ncbi:FKBP-type peptidyl-prolyl cis-trans isomerase [Niveibacterium sp. 24ML]|uniref:FKBP-type peptidyl-prolyl cis-trans isomerase n=1 Tax=Niveibacterium sp. 24ML TaxID=2985512 RepID=UPI0022709396|nr:FKBP-type peptidyl-prolyl cis-trans isomerase [Niveibacterium sp. 24ML]MCX9157108.1 FKBP-type peptidyl-prolyl cis-trans isomerase [Niveibacterium sp. 24ML]